MSVKIQSKGIGKLSRQLELLKLSSAQKRRYYRLLAKSVAFRTRKRIKAQKEVSGRSMKARSKGKKRMLNKIARSQNMKEYYSDKGATITWSDETTGQIANAHQTGASERHTAKELASSSAFDPKGPCTVAQAKKLKFLGYKRVLAKGKKKSPSVKWIRLHITHKLASHLILKLGSRGKQRWETKYPERPFLGANQSDIEEMGQEVMDIIKQQVKRRK